MRTILWVIILFGATAGAVTLTRVFVQTGAPKGAAVAVLAAALAIVPYCLVRTVAALSSQNSVSENAGID